jgi:hypothetical protein
MVHAMSKRRSYGEGLISWTHPGTCTSGRWHSDLTVPGPASASGTVTPTATWSTKIWSAFA